jgi:hypothetical protein
LAYRIRHARKDQEAPFPDQQGKRRQHPTARWRVHSFAGLSLVCQAGAWPIGRNLPDEPVNLLRLLGKPYLWFYDVGYS